MTVAEFADVLRNPELKLCGDSSYTSHRTQKKGYRAMFQLGQKWVFVFRFRQTQEGFSYRSRGCDHKWNRGAWRNIQVKRLRGHCQMRRAFLHDRDGLKASIAGENIGSAKSLGRTPIITAQRIGDSCDVGGPPRYRQRIQALCPTRIRTSPVIVSGLVGCVVPNRYEWTPKPSSYSVLLRLLV